MRRLLLIPLAMFLLLAGAVWWSGGAEADGKAEFTFINRGEIGTLDPNRMSWAQDIRVGYALWEGLYALDPVTIAAVPGCADPIELSEDKTVYTFHIRPEARWSDGGPVTSHDFAFAWQRMLEEPGDYTYLFHYIKGAKAYQEAFAKDQPSAFADVGIKAVDDKTLVVTLNHPVGFFPDICAFPPTFPLNERSMERFLNREVFAKSGKRVYDKKFTLPPNLVTNGPYRLASWEFKRRLRLAASDHYWNKPAVRSKTIEVVSSDDPLWGLTIYDAGRVDWLSDLTGELAAELREKGRKDLHVFPAFGTYFYSFNCQPTLPDGRTNPFADVRVRQAFSMAVNKRVIVDTITRLGEPITSNYIPPYAFEGYPVPKGQPHDVARAKQLLAEAGYPGGRGFPDVSLLFNNESQHGPIAQIVRRQWLDGLGVDVKLEGIEIKTFRQRLHGKDYAVARASWYGDYNDPSTFTDKYKSESENNDAAWKNPAYDALCARADVEKDERERLKLFAGAEQIMLDESPILPLYHYMNVYLFRDNVTGIAMHSRNQVMLQAVKVGRSD